MEITKENVPALLVQHGVVPQALIDQLDGDEDFLNAMEVVARLADVGKTLLDTDDEATLLRLAIRIFLMGPAAGARLCQSAGLVRDLGGTPDDVRAFIGAVLRKAEVSKLAESIISKAAAH